MKKIEDLRCPCCGSRLVEVAHSGVCPGLKCGRPWEASEAARQLAIKG